MKKICKNCIYYEKYSNRCNRIDLLEDTENLNEFDGAGIRVFVLDDSNLRVEFNVGKYFGCKKWEMKKVLNFKHWLKNKGVDVKKFWKRCKKKNQMFSDNYLHKRKALKKEDFTDWLYQAFNWTHTDEGYEYWNELNNQWIEETENWDQEDIVFGFK